MKQWILGILTFMIVFSLIGCNKETDNKLTKITLNEVAHSIFYAPQYAAIELGYFEEEGLDITLINGAGADNVMTALISGDAQIGFMGSEASIYVYSEGASDYAVNFAQLTQRAGNFLVGREEHSDFSWTNLMGKEIIGGRDGGMPQMVLEYILRQNGIDPKEDVSIIQNINFGLTAGAFSGGTGDYTVEFEPFATALELEGDGYVIASLGVDSGYIPYTAYSAKKSYLEKNPEIIQHFTNAIQKGINFVNTHTAEEIAKAISPQFPETDLKNLEIIVGRYLDQDTWKEDAIFLEDGFQLLQDVLEQSGQLSERVPYSNLVDTTFAIKAYEKQK